MKRFSTGDPDPYQGFDDVQRSGMMNIKIAFFLDGGLDIDRVFEEGRKLGFDDDEIAKRVRVALRDRIEQIRVGRPVPVGPVPTIERTGPVHISFSISYFEALDDARLQECFMSPKANEPIDAARVRKYLAELRSSGFEFVPCSCGVYDGLGRCDWEGGLCK